MNIPELIKEHHQAMIDKGFYDCPECDGEGVVISGGPEHHPLCDGNCIKGLCPVDGRTQDQCSNCHGQGKDPNKNIGELLMLIVSELSEALEAHRNNCFTNFKGAEEFGLNIETLILDENRAGFLGWFERFVKDTFEDEIADVFLRLFDLCGYKEWVLIDHTPISMRNYSDIPTSLLWITENVVNIRKDAYSINDVFNSLWWFCQHHNIPIEKHITAKMAYNKTRPHKHNKEY